MSNLFACLRTSANTLEAYNRALDVTQNNVSNASTPGYARQTVQLVAGAFDPDSGRSGGVATAEIQSTRDQFAEQSVRAKTTALGEAEQKAESLGSIESLFDVSGESGLADALSGFYEAASTWAESPNDSIARQGVIDQATTVASSFQQLASGLGGIADDTETQITQTVDQINSLAEGLRGYNAQILGGAQNDAGLDASVNSTLEELSELADISVLRQADGSATVLLNGETPLVIGDKQYSVAYTLESAISATYPDARPEAHILTSTGRDITSNTTGGQLGTLLDVHNTVIPSYLGSATQQGDLNTLAQQFADRVNQLLTSGTTSGGAAGVALFTYDSSRPTSIAQTLAVANVSTDQLAAADTEASNGVALSLAQLSDPEDDGDKIGGLSYTEFYGTMASHIGKLLDDANTDVDLQKSLLTQAKAQRKEMSGVSLDQEAMILTEFQKAYEAVSKVIAVLDAITETTIEMLRT